MCEIAKQCELVDQPFLSNRDARVKVEANSSDFEIYVSEPQGILKPSFLYKCSLLRVLGTKHFQRTFQRRTNAYKFGVLFLRSTAVVEHCQYCVTLNSYYCTHLKILDTHTGKRGKKVPLCHRKMSKHCRLHANQATSKLVISM